MSLFFLRFFLTSVALISLWLNITHAAQPLRVGHFPNLTHPQGVAGHAFTRQGDGWFEKWLGPEIALEWYVFKAGPSAIEALIAGSIDLVYVGPTPAINAYVKTKGQDVRVISGACNGGAALVVRVGSGIQNDADFKGKTIATPQLGNTQDISARLWLKSKGYQVRLHGGDVHVVPTVNADQLSLFIQKQLDAAWTVEPWVSRLEMQANGKIYLEEKQLWPQTNGKYATTLLATNTKMLQNHAALIKKWLQGHIALTEWLQKNPAEAKILINTEIQKETHILLPKEILDRAWDRIDISWDPITASIYRFADGLFQTGFFREKPSISSLCDLTPLNALLLEGRHPEIPQHE